MTVITDENGAAVADVPDVDFNDPASLEAFYGRFWAKVDRRGPDECWEWLASLSKGYGQLWHPARQKLNRAHRISFEIANGAIPERMEVCHRCDNRLCVNPAHLYVASHRQNIRDASAHGLMTRSICKRGHEFTPENTLNYCGQRRCRTCQLAYQVAWNARRKSA